MQCFSRHKDLCCCCWLRTRVLWRNWARSKAKILTVKNTQRFSGDDDEDIEQNILLLTQWCSVFFKVINKASTWKEIVWFKTIRNMQKNIWISHECKQGAFDVIWNVWIVELFSVNKEGRLDWTWFSSGIHWVRQVPRLISLGSQTGDKCL